MAVRTQVKELGGLSEGLTSSSRTASDPWLERFLLSEALRLSFHFWPFSKFTPVRDGLRSGLPQFLTGDNDD